MAAASASGEEPAPQPYADLLPGAITRGREDAPVVEVVVLYYKDLEWILASSLTKDAEIHVPNDFINGLTDDEEAIAMFNPPLSTSDDPEPGSEWVAWNWKRHEDGMGDEPARFAFKQWTYAIEHRAIPRGRPPVLVKTAPVSCD